MRALAAAGPEPLAAQQLYALSQGRRPSDWTSKERPNIDSLVDELVALRVPWERGALRGKWRLVYLQPGPKDVLYPDADRRLLFPELPWNDQYQIFGLSDVINVGEVWPYLGPSNPTPAHSALGADSLRRGTHA
eukprot:7389171-Prymnesium_polylepis.1